MPVILFIIAFLIFFFTTSFTFIGSLLMAFVSVIFAIWILSFLNIFNTLSSGAGY